VDKFLEDVANEYGTAKKEISKEAISKLQEFPWTGNIRELRNVVERLMILGEKTISLDDIKKYADYE
jgi:DNA-binding NtrC family response regulator